MYYVILSGHVSEIKPSAHLKHFHAQVHVAKYVWRSQQMLLVHFFNDPDLDFFTPSKHNISNLLKYKSQTFQKCVCPASQAIWTFLNEARINMASVCSLKSARLQCGGAEGQCLQAKGVLSRDTKRGVQCKEPKDKADSTACAYITFGQRSPENSHML